MVLAEGPFLDVYVLGLEERLSERFRSDTLLAFQGISQSRRRNVLSGVFEVKVF
jgi:hypothetical protein